MNRLTIPSWVSYVAPFALFILFTGIEPHVPRHLYPAAYVIKIVITTLAAWFLWPKLPQQTRMPIPGLFLSTVLGILLTGAWVVVDHITPHFSFLGSRESYNPFHEIKNHGTVIAFLAVRFFGLVCLVPFIEEIFYRGFLLHYVTAPDNFERIPVGVLTTTSVGVNIAFFALSHPEWLSAALFAGAMCFLIWKTKDIRNCILAHAITNLLLGIYVVMSGQWQYW